jgi:hypothetical protein
MLNKTINKRIYGNTLVVPALVAFFMLFQVNVAQESERNHSEYN